MPDEIITILENRKINAEYYKLVFSSKRLARNVLPGQFVHVKIDDRLNPFLRRPFSYYRVGGTRIELLYEILGRGTDILARKRKGETLQALGPLGQPFKKNLNGKKRILVAGGIGLPPLVFLAETAPPSERPLELLIGCRSKSEVLPKRELAFVQGHVRYVTDDGSYGQKGFVTVLLQEILKRENPEDLFIQTCGPRAMMEAVMNLARESGVEGEASIDTRMACGVGACLGCVVKTKSGFKTSCVDGPVFSFSELVKNGR